MAWLKVDERLFESEVGLGSPLATVIYLQALLYLMRFNLDALPAVIVDTWYTRIHGRAVTRKAVAHLVECGAFTQLPNGDYEIEHIWVEDECVIEGPGEWGNADVIAAARWGLPRVCVHCGSEDRLEVDHIVPRSRGGSSRPANLQILCKPCNMAKGRNVPWGSLRGSAHGA